jgi:branched-chain amino acid transport system substrate-binding protein
MLYIPNKNMNKIKTSLNRALRDGAIFNPFKAVFALIKSTLKRSLVILFTLIAIVGGGVYFYDPQLIQSKLNDFQWANLNPISLFSSEDKSKKEFLDIIAIADFSGPTSMVGKDLAQGFKDAANVANISKDVRLVIRDDRGNADAVSALADGAAAGFGTLAVIGPSQVKGYSEMASSLEEGMVPGLIPIAPPKTDASAKWIYSLQPSQERQGAFVLNLLDRVQNFNKIVFVVANGDSANGYLQGFQAIQAKNKKNQVDIRVWSKENSKTFISSLMGFDAVAFSLPNAEAVELVKGLKDDKFSGSLIGFGGASLPSFPEQFKNFPKEQLNPGFYTNGLIGVTPFSSSMTGENASALVKQYQLNYKADPSWAYAYGYDAGYILGQFLSKLKVEKPDWRKLSPEELRTLLKAYLVSLNLTQTNLGAFTGSIRFDLNKERDLPPTLVVFRNSRQVPYVMQYSTEDAKFSFTDKLGKNQIQLDERVYDLVPVVFTGIKMREISSINIEKKEFTAEFDLWFRSTLEISPEDIIFPNLAADNPLFTQIESASIKLEKYRLYRVRGVFYFDTNSQNVIMGQLFLPITWRHKYLDTSALRFVIESQKLSGNGSETTESYRNSNIVAPELNYVTTNKLLGVENILVDSLGNPQSDTANRRFSEVKLKLSLRSENASIGSILATKIGWIHAFICSFIFFVLAFLPKLFIRQLRDKKKINSLIWIANTGLSILFLEIGMFSSPLLDGVTSDWLVILQKSFIGFYFLVLGYLGTLLLSWFLDRKKFGRSMLKGSLQLFGNVIIYATLFCIFYSLTLNRDILPLLATSSVLLTVIGFAMREIILDALGGIAISIEGSIKPGDWVNLHSDNREIYGVIEELGWRNVSIHGRDDMMHFIPNSIVLVQIISNASTKGGYVRVEIPFEISSIANLKEIIDLVAYEVTQTLLQNEFVDHKKQVRIHCQQIEADGVEMIAHVYFRSDQSQDNLRTSVLEVVNRVLRQKDALPFTPITISNNPFVAD